jgi:hypothetical protein
MPNKRNEIIDQLLSDLKLLEQRLLSVRESDTLPFSFFGLSFDRMENISRSLHELELMQIGEMKEQMERLVRYLSEQPQQTALPVETERESMEKIIFPGYRDPRIGDEETPPAARSLNDVIQAPPALLDLKRGISLNDRFLFQRELFNNSRSEMDSVMENLNEMGSFEEAESYLRSEQGWNFEEQAAKEFLLVIKKGFE